MITIDLTIRINGNQERSIRELFDQLSWELNVLSRTEIDADGNIVEKWVKGKNDLPSPTKKSPVVAIATEERKQATIEGDPDDTQRTVESDSSDTELGDNEQMPSDGDGDENDKKKMTSLGSSKSNSSFGNAVSPTGPVQCAQCGKFFINHAFLSVHVRSHPLDLACKVCERKLPNKLSLESHMISHTDVRAFKCETCGSTFKRSSHLRAHERKKHSKGLLDHEKVKSHHCKECGKPFFTKGRMILHIKSYHPEVELSGEEEEANKTSFECETCHKVYPSKYSLKTHQIAHSEVKAFVCSICGMAFHRKSQLTRHGSRHSGIKPFHCPACGKGYLVKGRLWEHMKTHPNWVTSQQ